MSYVLSVIHPPVAPAAFGRAAVLAPVAHPAAVYSRVVYVLISEHQTPTAESEDFASAVAHELIGTQRTHTGTGVSFRIDHASTPPNVCPCCGRLVAAEGAMVAGDDDTLCDGCYTWHRATPQCLPANTAHTEEP